MRTVRRPGQGAGTPSPQAGQPGSSRADPTGMGGPHGQETAQDPRGLPSLPRRHPRQPCHHRGIDHRRATCSETGPCGSEEGRAEKGSHNREYLAARPILLLGKRARPVREGVVGSGPAPLAPRPTAYLVSRQLRQRRPGVAAQPGTHSGRRPTTSSPATTPKAVPYGIYDLAANTGWVNVGTDHDTAVFAAESLAPLVAVGRHRLPERQPVADHCRRWWLQRLPLPAVEDRTGRAGRRDRPGDHRLPPPTGHLEMESR